MINDSDTKYQYKGTFEYVNIFNQQSLRIILNIICNTHNIKLILI